MGVGIFFNFLGKTFGVFPVCDFYRLSTDGTLSSVFPTQVIRDAEVMFTDFSLNDADNHKTIHRSFQKMFHGSFVKSRQTVLGVSKHLGVVLLLRTLDQFSKGCSIVVKFKYTKVCGFISR